MEKILERDMTGDSKSHWLHLLSPPWEQSGLPSPYPRKSQYRLDEISFDIEEDIAARLFKIGKNNSMSVFVILLTSFQCMLHKYNDLEDIVVALPTLPSKEIQSNDYIIHRITIQKNMTFQDLLMQSREVLTRCYLHQHYPLAQVANHLGKNEERPWDIPVLFAMEDVHGDCTRSKEWLSKFQPELSVTAVREDAKITLNISYNAEQYSAELIGTYFLTFTYLLEQIVQYSHTSIDQLQLLNKETQDHILHKFNDTARTFDELQTLDGLFAESVQRVPERTAVMDDRGSLTYAELDQRSNRIGRMLQARGVVPGEHVAVMIDRSVDMITSVLAVLKSGGAYVPMEPSLPRPRIEHIILDLGIRYIVTKRAFLPHLSELIWKIPCLQEIIVLDEAAEYLAPEEIDHHSVGEMWDHFLKNGTDQVTRGGFFNSYNGEPFSEGEVEEYVEHVIELAKPYLHTGGRVLEVGCGSGLISFKLAGLADEVIGMDPSELTLDYNRDQASRLGISNLSFVHGFAHELTQKLKGEFDLIVIASTAHFFPGHHYTIDIIAQCMNLLREGGVLVMADLPDLGQKERFRESLEQHRQSHGNQGRSRTNIDTELYFNEEFFKYVQHRSEHALHYEVIHRKPQRIPNELQYRMDVVLSKQGAKKLQAEGAKQFWTAYHMEQFSDEPIHSTATSNDRAYVIFTSGSTGVPKGVTVNHRPVINLIDWVNRTYRVSHEDRVLFVTSLSFDLSVYDVFGLLAAGGSIRVVSEGDVRRADRLLQLIEEEEITFWDSAPAALQMISPLLEERLSRGIQSNSRLRLVFLSGDWIPLKLPPLLKRSFIGVEVVGLGGATEAAVWSNYFNIDEVKPEWTSIPYGRPIQNARYYILDSRLSPCPIHVPGELYIGGECLASGYSNQELTDQRFIPDPFVEKTGAVMYRTGDRARWMPDGNIEFLGRLDHQVKIRGYRVETAEIQAKMLQHSEIRESLVTDWTGSDGQKQLVAYFVASSGVILKAEELRDYLASTLPVYMVPSYFIQMDAMPLTANGKINRRLLPEPVQDSQSQEAYVAPRDEKEQTIAAIWSELLAVDAGSISIYDNFFHRGGNSMHIIQMHMKLSEHGFKVSTEDLFTYQTIETLAPLIGQVEEKREQAEIQSGQVPLHPNVAYSLSFENDPYKHRFGAKKWIQLPIRVEPDLVRNALHVLMNRHDALMLRYRRTEDGWVQRIEAPGEEIPLGFSDLSGYRDQEERDKVMNEIIQDLEENIDLEFGPLIYFHVFDCGEWTEMAYFMHHFTNDLHSMMIFEQELGLLIQQQVEGRPIQLPAPTSTFREFTEAMYRYAQSENCLKRISDWRSVTVLDYEIPRDLGGACVGWSFRELIYNFDISNELQLLGNMGRLGLKMNDIVTVAFLRMYNQWSGNSALVMNVFEDGRCLYEQQLDLSRTMGWLAAMIPVKFEIDPQAGVWEQLEQIKEQYANHPHDNSYWLLRYYHPDHSARAELTNLPAPQINFNFRGVLPDEPEHSAGGVVARKIPAPEAGKFISDIIRDNLLLFDCAIEKGMLNISWDYSIEVHTAATIDKISHLLIQEFRLIAQIVGECDR